MSGNSVERLIAFAQKVAAQRRAMCKSDHHAATCRGAVNLAEDAARLLSELGIEPRYPQPESGFSKPCPLCGEGGWVMGQVWYTVQAHATCLAELSKQQREDKEMPSIAAATPQRDREQRRTDHRQELDTAVWEACLVLSSDEIREQVERTLTEVEATFTGKAAGR